MSTGDVLSQFLVQKRCLAEYDVKRTLRFAFFGTFLGVSMHNILVITGT